MSCDIIIPVHNMKETTGECLESICSRTHSSFRLILIDNGSGADTKAFLEKFASTHNNVLLVRNDDNAGWVRAINQGIRLSESAYVCVMNNDTIARTDDWLAGLMAVAEKQEDIGLVNPRFDTKKDFEGRSGFIEIDFCRGYCVLIKRSVIDKIGGLDEAYGLGYYDDDDYSVRAIRAGFRCVRAGGVYIEHKRDSTFSALFTDQIRRELHSKNKELFYSKWGRRLNIFFTVSGLADIEKLSSLFFALARRQHIIYVWSLVRIPTLDHINIRMIPFARFMFPLSGIMLFFNSKKRPAKRYDLIFRIESGKIDERSILDKVDKAAKI